MGITKQIEHWKGTTMTHGDVQIFKMAIIGIINGSSWTNILTDIKSLWIEYNITLNRVYVKM